MRIICGHMCTDSPPRKKSATEQPMENEEKKYVTISMTEEEIEEDVEYAVQNHEYSELAEAEKLLERIQPYMKK